MGSFFALSLFVMGCTLAHYGVSFFFWTCNVGSFLHGGCFCVVVAFGGLFEGHKRRFLWLNIGFVTLFFVVWSWGVLSLFGVEREGDGLVLWELGVPYEVLFAWVATGAFGEAFLWTLRLYRKEHWWSLWSVGLLSGLLGHLVRWHGVDVLQGSEAARLLGFLLGYLFFSLVVVGVLFLCDLSEDYALARTRPLRLPKWFGGFLFIGLLFCAAVLFTNLLVVKRIILGGYPVTASLLVYVWTFALTDVLTEVYGGRFVRWVVWGSWLASVTMLSVLGVVSLLHLPSDSTTNYVMFRNSFGFVGITGVGSMVAFLVSQFTDVYIFEWLKAWSKGKSLWLRNNLATWLSQLVDTVVFAVFVWWVCLFSTELDCGWMEEGWWWLAFYEYGWKVVLALADTGVVYFLVYLWRRWFEEEMMEWFES